jgi:hypothetical protein
MFQTLRARLNKAIHGDRVDYDTYFTAMAALDRIMIEAKSLEDAKRWAHEALVELGEYRLVGVDPETGNGVYSC